MSKLRRSTEVVKYKSYMLIASSRVMKGLTRTFRAKKGENVMSLALADDGFDAVEVPKLY